ncbi:MAG: hypothetical protein ABSA59_04685 [Terriglobia bacterium]
MNPSTLRDAATTNGCDPGLSGAQMIPTLAKQPDPAHSLPWAAQRRSGAADAIPFLAVHGQPLRARYATMLRFCAVAAMLFVVVSLGKARELRDRDWLVGYVRQPILATAFNQRCLNIIQRQLDNSYLGLDLEFLGNGGANKSRAQTNTIGRLAFTYHTPGLRYYHDGQLLEKLRLAYLAATKHIGPDGFITWPGDSDYFFEAHEQAWRLEPLLLGYIWVGDEFPARDRAVIEAALQRSAGWLIRHPLNQRNNRGAVWCAIATLCGVYFQKPEYLNVVEKYADTLMKGVVWDDGEVGEHTAQQDAGGGPDSNYSYTAIAYVYLYRLFSGKDEMDERLLGALRWFAVYNTRSGFPTVAGASVRRFHTNANVRDLLPALQRFSRRESFFATISQYMLAKEEKFSPIFGGHVISPLIWAMLEPGAEPVQGSLPDWDVDYTRVFNRQRVQYALISRAYQTGVVFRGKKGDHGEAPFRGLQTFATGAEYPILLHTDTAYSTATADGIDTASTDVDQGREGAEVLLSKGAKGGRSELATITERRKTLWTLYGFTPASALVIYGGAQGEITSRWVLNRAVIAPPSLRSGKRAVLFQGNHGRINYLAGKAKLFSVPGKSTDMLEVVSPAPISAFGFSDGSLRFRKFDRLHQRVLFSDRSGRYSVSLLDITGPDGMLNRDSPFRLVAQP